ncbi:MAG: Snf7 family protein [Candidatus Bathyarchaeota archaeon]|nr:Snf7 family protein [Candidatus Bathyarchaeota archaeon]
MSKKFSKKWEGGKRRLIPAIRKPKPLKPQINYAANRVEQQIHRVDNYINRYTDRDRSLFEKIVQAQEKHDNRRAKIFADELAEIRKQRNLLMNAKLSLDNVALRLRTVFEFGNFVSAVSPVVGTLQNIKKGISGIMPEVGNELGDVGLRLNDLVVEMGQGTGTAFDFEVSSEDAQKIIEEAAIVAENRMKMKLPELPTEESGQGGHLIIRKDYSEDNEYSE